MNYELKSPRKFNGNLNFLYTKLYSRQFTFRFFRHFYFLVNKYEDCSPVLGLEQQYIILVSIVRGSQVARQLLRYST